MEERKHPISIWKRKMGWLYVASWLRLRCVCCTAANKDPRLWVSKKIENADTDRVKEAVVVVFVPINSQLVRDILLP